VARGRRVFGPYDFTTGGSVQLAKGAGPGGGAGRVWLVPPEGARAMTTTIENPTAQALEMEVGVNGATTRCTVPAHATARVESQVPNAAPLAITFRGDRRLVLLETSFITSAVTPTAGRSRDVRP
jgi:hypothetical protein